MRKPRKPASELATRIALAIAIEIFGKHTIAYVAEMAAIIDAELAKEKT